MSTRSRAHHHHDHPRNADVKVRAVEQPDPRSQNIGEDERSHLIQVRAYGMWELAGRPHSDASRERFWCEAEKELRS